MDAGFEADETIDLPEAQPGSTFERDQALAGFVMGARTQPDVADDNLIDFFVVLRKRAEALMAGKDPDAVVIIPEPEDATSAPLIEMLSYTQQVQETNDDFPPVA